MIPLPNVFLVGPTGTGKTTALRSIVRAGLELFVQLTEPHQALLMTPHLDWEKALGLPPIDINKIHYSYTPAMASDNEVLMRKYEMVQQYSWDQLKKMTQDPDKGAYVSWQRFAGNLLVNFRCDHCGKEFGPVTDWGHDRALAVDSLTGLNDMALQLITGASVARTDSQMGAAMDTELGLLGKKLPLDTKCMYVLVAHVRRIYSDLAGGMTKVPHAIGKANAPDWPKNFADSILCVRQGNEYTWSTADSEFDMATRNLPVAAGMPPSFVPLLRTWWEQSQQQGL